MMVLNFFLELAALFLGCVLVRKSWPAPYRFLLGYKCLAFFIAVVSMAWSTFFRQSNHWIYNLYNPIECALLLYVYYRAAVHPAIKRLDLSLLAVLPPLIFIVYLLVPVLYSLNSMAGIGYLFLLILSSCGVYVDLLLDKGDLPIFRHPLFWLAAGVLLYSICMILFFLTWEYSKKMILYRFFSIIYFGGAAFLNLGIIGCFSTVRKITSL